MPKITWFCFLIVIALRLPALSRDLWLDEYASLLFINHASIWDMFRDLRADTHHPAYFFCLYLWSKISFATPWLRLLSWLFDVATIYGLKQTCRRISETTSLLAVLLWGLCPLALRYSVEIRPYAMLTCVTFFTAMLTQHVINKKTYNIASCCMLILLWSLLIGVHPVGIIALYAIVIALLLVAQRKHYKYIAYQLATPWVIANILFVVLHWYFTRSPTGGGQIDWIPKVSINLICRICNYIYNQTTIEDASYLGLVVFIYLISIGFAGRFGRLWSLAAVVYTFMIILFSIYQQPIFWYHVLTPAIMLSAWAAAYGLAQYQRWCLLMIPLFVWQLLLWLPIATRALDPTNKVATDALASRLADDTIFVFPDFMRITFLPLLQAPHVVGLSKVNASLQHTQGIAVLRASGLDFADTSNTLMQQLQQLKQYDIFLHDIYIFIDNDDDTSVVYQNKRDIAVQQINHLLGACNIIDRQARVAHMVCLKLD